MTPLGGIAPRFELRDASGVTFSSDTFDNAPATLVMFICNHCPFVKHVQKELAVMVAEYQQRGVVAIGINSNDAVAYPEDAPELMLEEIERVGYTFPYLYDESQKVARMYGAACTPDFFVYDASRRLAYRGQMDGSRPSNDVANDGVDLRRALDAVLGGETPSDEQYPSVGCNIKWRDND